MHLQSQVTLDPSEKWGMGPIDRPSGQKRYIFVCTDYLTKWAKTKVIKLETKEEVVYFLRENVFTSLVTREI